MATSEIGKNSFLDTDWRARLQVMRANKDDFFGKEVAESDLMFPLKDDRGIVFQYQPSMFIAYAATYDTQVFQGSNYPLHTYMSSTPPTIPIQVQYSCTNQEEARYLLAMMQFLKVSTKSQFGEMAVMNNKVGRPPPVLEFSYLGPHGYDRVPVVINDVNFIMVNNVDYIPVAHPSVQSKHHVSAFKSESSEGGSATVTYVPTDIDMTITCLPQYSPRRIRRTFNLDDMRQGKNIGFI
jgi:hypothetical protein